MLARTAAAARKAGASRYFTGKPCRRGHLCGRTTASRACIECQAIVTATCRQRNIDYWREKEARARARTRRFRLDYSRQRYAERRHAAKAASKKWLEQNRAKSAAKTSRRKAAKLRACPPWADLKRIEAFYVQARALTESTGIPHEVDHIHPLQGEMLCGLHVPWNLQILPKSENSRKKNYMIDAALTPAPEKSAP